MTQARNGLLTSTLLVLTLSLLAVGSSASATTYYLYEYVDGDGDTSACCIEFASDSFDVPSDTFDEVTLTELENAGYKCADDQISDANETDSENQGSRTGISWIDFDRVGARLYCYRGSQTETQTTERVDVTSEYWCYDNQGLRHHSKRSAVDYNGPMVNIWWRTKHNPPPYYSWVVQGTHKWAGTAFSYQTNVEADEPEE
ncbi:hypothetical protein JXB37_03425 [candidate division WOR-3 bacterium]|nr:hypothetical protein [candidate division WOR-3 bacterium]